MMRYGRLKGTMEQCIKELQESDLPSEFLLTQVRSLIRYLREVDGLCSHVKNESGWGSDTTAYLEILCAKEDSNLARRVSDTRILKQDFDEKRREWRKTKKNVINAISEMNARALKFECSERKTIALHAIQYYKNVMGKDDGAIPGESESTDGLIDQYRRHRDEISKIPMYADSIMKMLKDIRRTVTASAKLQPGSNAFTQFLEEWWTSVVNFLQHSSIVDAEKNAREVMQTLKKLKGKQEENKKRELSRLMSKLDAQEKETPPITPASEGLENIHLDDALNPEKTGGWKQAEDEEDSCTASQGGSSEDDAATECDFDDVEHEAVDRVSELGHDGGAAWSDTSPSHSDMSFTQDRALGGRRRERAFTCASRLPQDAGNVSVTSWDACSEPTQGTDAGTDQDIAAASGLPEGESDDDQDEDEFEAADSLDLGAVALCAVGTGADGGQTYQDATCTPQAIRHMTARLGVEQAMPPPPPGPSRLLANRGREARRGGRGRRLSSGGRSQRGIVKQTSTMSTSVSTSAALRPHSLYVSSTSTASMTSTTTSTRFQACVSNKKKTTRVVAKALGSLP